MVGFITFNTKTAIILDLKPTIKLPFIQMQTIFVNWEPLELTKPCSRALITFVGILFVLDPLNTDCESIEMKNIHHQIRKILYFPLIICFEKSATPNEHKTQPLAIGDENIQGHN